MTVAGTTARFSALPGPVRSGIWMSVSAVTYVVSIAIGRYLAPEIDVCFSLSCMTAYSTNF